MKISKFFVAIVVSVAFSSVLMAADPCEIELSIQLGLDWLAANQNDDGSWSSWGDKYEAGTTGLVLAKFGDRAYELGYDTPFDENYIYCENVKDGFDYLFKQTQEITISTQPAGNPDTSAKLTGKGIRFLSPSASTQIYNTGIALMAITCSRSPNRIVATTPCVVNGWSYKEVTQEAIDYLAYAQRNAGSSGRGGWGYSANNQPDQSNTGYAVLGLAYAESHDYDGFGCTIPEFVKDELNYWIDYMQNPSDGGSYYGGSYAIPHSRNVLRTGNLIFEMAFVGYGTNPPTQRLRDAIEYLDNNWSKNANSNLPGFGPGWRDPNPSDPCTAHHYQAMYCITKGLDYAGIDRLQPSNIDWYYELADVAVNTQIRDASPLNGSWPRSYRLYYGDNVLATVWALLYLERAAPPSPKHDEPKWSQPPVVMPVYVGWNEESHDLLPRMVADDFLCDSNEPVTAIRWWGSFLDWRERTVPSEDELPDGFYITIWDDVPDPDPNDPNYYSHPSQIIWENYCYNYDVKFHGWEFDPRIGNICKIDLTKFEFYQEFEPNDHWYQPDDNQMYWLGIMALYLCDCNADFDGDGDVDADDIDAFILCWGNPPVGGCRAKDLNCDGVIDDKDLLIVCCQVAAGWPDPNCCDEPNLPTHLWGWETRKHVFQDDAVRFFDYPLPNQTYDANAFEPIEFDRNSWDLSFELLTEPSEPPSVLPPILGDINRDDYVDFFDVAILAGNWLECYNPGDPNCTWEP